MSIQVTTNSINATPSNAMRTLIGNGTTIIAGWFKPAPLAATDTLWNMGATELTTSGTNGGLSIVIERATTNRILLTENGTIVSNVWNFMCFVVSGQSPTYERMWSCTEGGGLPRMRAITTTQAGSGNLINATALNFGSDSGQTDDFGGLISQVTVVVLRQTTSSIDFNDEYLYNRFVLPIFQGTFDRQHFMSAINGTMANNTNQDGGIKYMPFDCVLPGSNGTYNIYEFTTGDFAAQPGSVSMVTNTGFNGSFSSDEPSAARFNANITNGLLYPGLLRR